jgi:hypothetical protein
MEVLRGLIRSRGLRYRDVAAELGVTERTVMRWFASGSVDTVTVEALCSLVGLSFFEVCEQAARRVDTRLTRLSVEQEQELVDDPLLNYCFTFLLKGWSPDDLRREMAVPEPMFVDALLRLERSGLIEVLPGNRTRLRTTRDIQWRQDGPYSQYMTMFLRWSLREADATEGRSLWSVEPLKLSTGSLAQLRRKFDQLREEAMALGEQDRRSGDVTRDWYALVLTARHFAMPPLSQWNTLYRQTDYPPPASRRAAAGPSPGRSSRLSGR